MILGPAAFESKYCAKQYLPSAERHALTHVKIGHEYIAITEVKSLFDLLIPLI
jgi:hypothetical protein